MLYVDWSSFDPNQSLFGTVNPPVCLPSDQREEDNAQATCAPSKASVDPLAHPVGTALLVTANGLRVVPVFAIDPR